MDLKTISPDVDNDITLGFDRSNPPDWQVTIIDDGGFPNIEVNDIYQNNVGKWIATVSNFALPYLIDTNKDAYAEKLTLKSPSPIYNVRVLATRGQSISFHTGIEAYADILKAAILTQRTELQLYPSRGIPYFETAFDSPLKVRMWADAVRRTTNSFPWVARILDFEYNFSDEIQDNDGITHRNGLTYTLRVLTDLGVATVRSDET